MDAELLARYGGPVPRYTSYPTAPHFRPDVTATTYVDWLAAIADDNRLSLYLHVPFCAALCWYCGCHTKVVNRYAPLAAYVSSLSEEIAMVAGAIPGRPTVTQVHWGGGTPSMLAPGDFGRLMAALRSAFRIPPTAEVAIEIDPRGLDVHKTAALAEAGVTRASLGVQDFNPAVQKAINRIQTYEETAQAVARLRAAGIGAINLDLMYGLPRQSVEDAVRTAEAAASLAPERVALFGYAHVPWMKRHQRLIDEADLPDSAARWAQAEAAAATLVAQGYRRIGLDHFAAEGDTLERSRANGGLRRNFQGYTDDDADVLLGFGASAIGRLRQGYVQNAAGFRDYAQAIEGGRPAVVRGRRLTADDRLRAAIIERLMCDLRVDLAAVSEAQGAPAANFATEVEALSGMADDGLVALEGSLVRVTEAGRPLVRAVAAVFDAYLAAGAARHARAV